MAEDRWHRVEKIFAAAVDLDAAARRQLLERECDGDEELLRELQSLFAADRDSGLLGEVVAGAAADLVTERDTLADGHRLGPWLVNERLGEGGMSVVYRARRADAQFHKQVALKVLKRGMDSDEILGRFQVEREILARLEHPNIARLLDAGTTRDGQPYFVMELVEGEPIDVFSDRRRLGIDQRLHLFRKVSSAVAHAHHNLVVHRDLKPSNILVTDEGVPKLLDFGIAKLLDPERSPLSGEITAAPLRLLTPGYASPEQVSGGVVTTASDIYSLGVVLYQLLCGRRPYRLTGRSSREIERAILDQAPQPPSSALQRLASDDATPSADEIATERGLDVRELARRLNGDLDTVVLQALHKEPQARYPSVEYLVDDLERYRRRQPVTARRQTLRYRTGLFLRRHRLGVTVAAAATLVLVAFVAALILQTLRLEREQEASERRLRLAEEVKEFLIDLFPVAGPQGAGAQLTARELLDRGAARATADTDHSPAVRAARLDTVGRVYQRLGLYRQAEPLLEESLEEYRASAGRKSAEYAASLNRLAILRVQQGDFEKAEPLFTETLEARRALFGPRHPLIADSLNNLALLRHDHGDFSGAEPLYRQALAMDTALEGPDAVATLADKANLGLLLYDLGDYPAAEELLGEVITGRESHLGASHEDIAEPLTYLAMAFTEQNRLREAERLLGRALAIVDATVGRDHPEAARVLAPMAELERARGNFALAEELHQQALALRLQRLEEEHPEVTSNVTDLAWVLLDAGRPQEAEPLFQRTLEIYRRTDRADRPDAAHALAGLGRLRLEASDSSGALLLLNEAASILELRLPPEHPRNQALAALLSRATEAAESESRGD